jgi:hypothetical protein
VAYVVLWSRAAVAGVFLVSLAGKVRGRAALAEFVSSVGALEVVPRRWSRPAAYGAVAAEGSALLLVAIPATVPLGLASGAVLLSAFTAAIAAALRRGVRTPCRCFGASTTRLGLPHVVRNLALVAVCATGLVAAAPATDPARHPDGVATALVGAATVVLLVARFDDLVELFAAP